MRLINLLISLCLCLTVTGASGPGRSSLVAVRDHLYGTTPDRWDASCRAIGGSSSDIERVFDDLVDRK